MVKLKYQGESVQGGPTGAVESQFVISGATTREAALEQLANATDLAPQTISHAVYGDLVREAVPQIDEVDAEAGYWFGTVRWVPAAEMDFSGPEIDDPTVSFDTTGGTTHIDYSKETISRQADPGFEDGDAGVPRTNKLIGIDLASGVAAGTDIVSPNFVWEETHAVPASMVNRAYRQKLFRCTGTVCSEPFRDFAPGEALFLGATGSRRSHGNSGPWLVSFKFAGSANREQLNVAGIVVSQKRGWDYLWIFQKLELQQDAKVIVPRPKAVFVERVYDYVPWDFMPGSSAGGGVIGGITPGPIDNNLS